MPNFTGIEPGYPQPNYARKMAQPWRRSSESVIILGFSPSGDRFKRTAANEAHLPAFNRTQKENARLSRAHENKGWTCRVECTPGEGARALGCLSNPKVLANFDKLRSSSDFEAVLRGRLRVVSRNFVMRACANTVGHARVGIIAGRKAAPRAVDRNRGKRLIREVFRGSSQLAGHDVTVQLRTNLRTEHNSAVRTELQNLILSLARQSAGVTEARQPERPGLTSNGQ